MNEEVGVAIASVGGGVGEVQEEEYGTADQIITGMRELDAIIGNVAHHTSLSEMKTEQKGVFNRTSHNLILLVVPQLLV